MSTTGTCALCQATGVVLIDSHIVSQWVYRRILGSVPGGKPHGVTVAAGRAAYSGKQAKTPLLCRPCEDRLGDWEDYAARNALQKDGITFSALASAVTVAKDTEMELVDLSALDLDKLTRFAVSVFWRADVAGSSPIVNLGAAREPIRLYLLGATLPSDIEVILGLIKQSAPGIPRVDRLLVYPETDTEQPQRHQFIACGMDFRLFTAPPSIPAAELPHLAEASLPRKGRGFVSDGGSIRAVVAGKAQASTAYGKLARKARKP